MVKVLEKYETTISEMKADVEVEVRDSKVVYAAKQKERIKLKTILNEMEARKQENYQKFFTVAKEFLKLVIKDFFKRSVTMESFQKVIHPVNEYIKYSNEVEEVKEQLEQATEEESKALAKMNSVIHLLESIKSIG